MRGLCLAFLLAACSGGGLPPNSSDGGASDFATPGGDLAARAPDLRGVDLAGPPSGTTCVSTCNRCAGGGCCGSACCAAGEWCDATFTCRCGTGAACTGTLLCAAGGIVAPGADQCGFTCCGDAQHPCPL
jgi:hypothetical protein